MSECPSVLSHMMMCIIPPQIFQSSRRGSVWSAHRSRISLSRKASSANAHLVIGHVPVTTTLDKMWPHLSIALPCLILSARTAVAYRTEEYNEELTLRPLPDGKLAARFAFSTVLKGAAP